MQTLQRYSPGQLATLLAQLQSVTLAGAPVFTVSLINARTDAPIAPEEIVSSGLVYLCIELPGFPKRFPVWVEVA
jgi:hypothetical protein